VVGLEAALLFFPDEPQAVDVLGGNPLLGLGEHTVQPGIGVVDVAHVRAAPLEPDPHILGIVGVVMAASGNQTVGAVKSELTQRRNLHIAIGIIADVLAVAGCKPVVGIVGECGIAAAQKVARRVVGEGLLCLSIGAQIGGSTQGNPGQIVVGIGILHVLRLVGLTGDSPKVIVVVDDAGDHSAAGGLFHGAGDTLCIVIRRGDGAAVGLGDADDVVICVIGVGGGAVCPVGDPSQIVIGIVLVGDGGIIRVGQPPQVTHGV